jgi:hypothetical protein
MVSTQYLHQIKIFSIFFNWCAQEFYVYNRRIMNKLHVHYLQEHTCSVIALNYMLNVDHVLS